MISKMLKYDVPVDHTNYRSLKQIFAFLVLYIFHEDSDRHISILMSAPLWIWESCLEFFILNVILADVSWQDFKIKFNS